MVTAILSALAFAFGNIPSVMLFFKFKINYFFMLGKMKCCLREVTQDEANTVHTSSNCAIGHASCYSHQYALGFFLTCQAIGA